MELNCIYSDKFTVTVGVGGKHYKVLQITLSKPEHPRGGIFVQWPYYKKSHGLLSVLELPPGNKTEKISFLENGKVTSHNVKFAHHYDGQAHFSQDGKVYTRIRKISEPLSAINGHFFTAQLQGLHDFEEVIKARDGHHHSPTRAVVNFDFNDLPESIKIVGYWRRVSTIKLSAIASILTPRVWLQALGGKVTQGFVLAEKDYLQASRVLIITCESIPKLSQDSDSCFTLIGEFDSTKKLREFERPTTFLGANYPTNNFDFLRSEIGSIDYKFADAPYF